MCGHVETWRLAFLVIVFLDFFQHCGELCLCVVICVVICVVVVVVVVVVIQISDTAHSCSRSDCTDCFDISC